MLFIKLFIYGTKTSIMSNLNFKIQVIFILIALYVMQIVTKQLYRDQLDNNDPMIQT